MKLTDLQHYRSITIQCHDNPDADAIASGFVLYTYFASLGKEVRLVYAGINQFSEIYNPLDMDMRDAVPCEKTMITLFRNSNLSLQEMESCIFAIWKTEKNFSLMEKDWIHRRLIISMQNILRQYF